MFLTYKKQVYRLANILDLLIKRDRMVSIMEIAKINNCTERTVYNDIYYIIENWNELIQLDFSHASIISSNTSIGNIHFIYENIIARQPHTKLLRLIIEKPNQTIEFYGEAIEMSEQSTRKLLKDICTSLIPYDISLNCRPRKFEIVGRELDVRLFIASFYNNFQRSFVLPRMDSEYDDALLFYFDISSNFTDFLGNLSDAAMLRHKQEYYLEPRANYSIEEDINQTLQQFITALQEEEVKITDYLPELITVLENMGYKFESNEQKRLSLILSHILYMRQHIYTINNIKLHSVHYYIKNYARAYQGTFEVNRRLIEAIIEKITPDYKHVVANLIFNIDSIQPRIEQPRNLKFMVYSDISHDHAHALKRHLSINFPLNYYYVYSGPTNLRSPKQKDCLTFIQNYGCNGIISTCDFPYKLNQPKVTVSSYLVGSDIGRIYDFLNDLKHTRIK